MHEVLRPFLGLSEAYGKFVVLYFDDILVYSCSEKEGKVFSLYRNEFRD
jgi:hypothetical protein